MDPQLSGHLNLALLSAATETHFFSALQNASLLSVVQMCDYGCPSIFNKKSLQVLYSNKKLILTGERNASDSLWDIPLTPPSLPASSANDVVQMNQTKNELVQFLHSTCFSPAPSTFIKAIKNIQLSTCPGLTEELISKHLPLSPATTKGHLKQEFKNILPTINIETATTFPDTNPEPEELLSVTHDFFVKMVTKEEGFAYSNISGHYPINSVRGNQNILVCYDYDSNDILTSQFSIK